MADWKKVLDFIATAEDISVINILLILNPKHSSYYSVLAKTRTPWWHMQLLFYL